MTTTGGFSARATCSLPGIAQNNKEKIETATSGFGKKGIGSRFKYITHSLCQQTIFSPLKVFDETKKAC